MDNINNKIIAFRSEGISFGKIGLYLGLPRQSGRNRFKRMTEPKKSRKKHWHWSEKAKENLRAKRLLHPLQRNFPWGKYWEKHREMFKQRRDQKLRDLKEKNQKQCQECREEKALSEFYFYPSNQTYDRFCKACNSIISKRKYGEKDHKKSFEEKRQGVQKRREKRIERINLIGIKVCSKCKKTKKLTDFEFIKGSDKTRPHYLASCRECHSEFNRFKNKKYRLLHPEKFPHNRYAQRLANRQIGITNYEIGKLFSEYKRCPYCGIKLNGKNKVLDHMIPLFKGGIHDPQNLLVCCLNCNQEKRAKSFENWTKQLDPFHQKLAINIFKRKQEGYQMSLPILKRKNYGQ